MTVVSNLELLGTRAGRRQVWRIGLDRLCSRRSAVGIARDLTVPWPTPPAKVPFEVRQLQPDDDLSLVADVPGLDPRQAQDRANQRWLLSSGLPVPWIAVDQEGSVCLITWLLTERDNEAIQAVFRRLVPALNSDEVSIEGSFTAESHRGLGILPAAATQLVDRAKDHGARRATTFMAEWNASSLRAGEKAGWFPYTQREERWLLFRQRVRFLPMGADAL